MTPTTLATHEAPSVGERYGPEWAVFARPGDRQEDAWLLRFDDQDRGDVVWAGEDAEAEAWKAWNRYAPTWNCHLFRVARLREPSPPREKQMSELERLRELEEAVRDYAGRYMQDEAADTSGDVCSEDQHLSAKRVCDALVELGK